MNSLKEKENYESELMESLQINYNYLSKSIEDSNAIISQFDSDDMNIDQLLESIDFDEMSYIMDKLGQSAINYAIMASEMDEELKEKSMEIKKISEEFEGCQHLLGYMVNKEYVSFL